MSRWFRFYAGALRNPKVLRLSDKDFRLWVRLLAVASENDGHIPDGDDLRLVLNMRLDHLSSGVDRLISGGLIDAIDDGYEPHGWAKFQYKSDTSTERVHKHREKRNVSETPPETEAEAEIKVRSSKDDSPSSDEPSLKPEHVFEGYQALAGELGLSVPRDFTPERRQLVRGRITQYSMDDFQAVFAKCRGSPFLRGDARDGRTPLTFDWLMKKANFQKALEGNYDR
jgi:hypothetical protein